MKCADCIHYGICNKDICFDSNFEQMQNSSKVDIECHSFCDSKRIIYLPMPTTEELYSELASYCEERIVDEL